MLPSFTQMPPLQFTNDALAFAVAVIVIVVLFGSEVPAGFCEAVPGPLTPKFTVYFVTVVTPLPVRLRFAPPFGEFVCAVRMAALVPVACGVKVIVTEQEPPIGIVTFRQLFVWLKSPGFEPEIEKPFTVSGPVACKTFSNVTVSGELEPVAVSGNNKGFCGALNAGYEAGATDTAEIGNVRVPVFELIVNVPVNVPTVVGANVTVAVQFPPGATGDEHVLGTDKLGSPLTATLDTFRGP